jgi:hypothetical protein
MSVYKRYYKTLGSTIKIILPQQAKLLNMYKPTKYKLLKANAAKRFNKICNLEHLLVFSQTVDE